MRAGISWTAVGCLLLMITSVAACDFRQMIEDRPVALPEDSTAPKDTHSAETRSNADPIARPE